MTESMNVAVPVEPIRFEYPRNRNLRLVENESEREQVRRFWYAVYVEEMNRKQFYADHASKTICDPLEPTGHVLAAWENNEIVGTVRVNFTRDGGLDEYVNLYGCRAHPDFDEETTSIVTRLMVARHKRSTRLGLDLALAIYQFGVENRNVHCYIDCNAHLVAFFQKLGFVPMGMVSHPEYGDVDIMRLSCLDADHLTACGSPLYKVLEAHRNNSGNQSLV